MTRRDLATIGLYGLAFASVVLWASLRPASDRTDPPRGFDRVLSGAAPLERSEGLPEMRRVVQYMLVR